MASNHIGAERVYSREFLLKFRTVPSCQELPEGVDISPILGKSARSNKEQIEDKKKQARGFVRPKRDVKEKDKRLVDNKNTKNNTYFLIEYFPQ